MLRHHTPGDTVTLPVRDALAALTVQDASRTGYTRDTFEHWTDADRDPCNTRAEVLLAEAVTVPETGPCCTLTGGSQYSAYDDQCFDAARKLDAAHLLPVLAQDRRALLAATLSGVFAGLFAIMLTVTCDLWFAYEPTVLQYFRDVFSLGLPFGLMLGFIRSAWVEYVVAPIRLAVRRRVPWRFMSFLADAHERRGVLRQAAAVYQLRHIDLQRHLAAHQP